MEQNDEMQPKDLINISQFGAGKDLVDGEFARKNRNK